MGSKGNRGEKWKVDENPKFLFYLLCFLLLILFYYNKFM